MFKVGDKARLYKTIGCTDLSFVCDAKVRSVHDDGSVSFQDIYGRTYPIDKNDPSLLFWEHNCIVAVKINHLPNRN